MEGLTAKVFRTYNASRTLQEQLDILTNRKTTHMLYGNSTSNIYFKICGKLVPVLKELNCFVCKRLTCILLTKSYMGLFFYSWGPYSGQDPVLQPSQPSCGYLV